MLEVDNFIFGKGSQFLQEQDNYCSNNNAYLLDATRMRGGLVEERKKGGIERQ